MKNFERELPEGYREVYSIDATDKKVGVLLTVASLAIFAAIAIPAVLLIRPAESFFESYSLVRNIVALAVLAAYVVLHELVHGIAYKCLTGEKLTFGLTLTCAYCGVPNVYVYRRTALISLLAPFVVFSILFAVPLFLPIGGWNKIYCAVIFALHVGGCAGDLYDTLLYLLRFKRPDTLMRDTGPKQVFYLK